MIKVQIYLKCGQQIQLDELNKAMIEGDYLMLSTFRGQYICIDTNEIASFEVRYPQNKAPKAYAIFRQIVDQLSGGVYNENNNK